MAKNVNSEKNLAFLSGLYTRVAHQVGVHPSYVSRVARGERRSEKISHAISAELAQFVQPGSETFTKDHSAENLAQVRRKLIRKLKSNPRLSKMSTMIIDQEDWLRSGQGARVTRANLQGRIAKNALMIAASVEQFHRASSRLEDFDHVLSLTDNDGIVLYSYGTTGMIRQQGRVPGANWSKDFMGPSAAARAIAAGVPLIIVGPPDPQEKLLTVRMACPIRLGDRQVAGVVVLTINVEHSRAEHLIDICKIARRICRLVERERQNPERSRSHFLSSPVQPFEEAELHLARVMSMPQVDQATRSHLATVLAELEGQRREVLLAGDRRKTRRSGNAKAQGV
jgi:transcriptional regulator of acetoin/glycerol metabolism